MAMQASYPYTDPNTELYPNPNSNPNSNPESYPNTNSNPNSEPYTDRSACTVAFICTHPHWPIVVSCAPWDRHRRTCCLVHAR